MSIGSTHMPNYIIRRKRGFALYVRVVVPKRLRALLGKRELRRNLRLPIPGLAGVLLSSLPTARPCYPEP
jgi:hypothetical protein